MRFFVLYTQCLIFSSPSLFCSYLINDCSDDTISRLRNATNRLGRAPSSVQHYGVVVLIISAMRTLVCSSQVPPILFGFLSPIYTCVLLHPNHRFCSINCETSYHPTPPHQQLSNHDPVSKSYWLVVIFFVMKICMCACVVIGVVVIFYPSSCISYGLAILILFSTTLSSWKII